MIRRTLGVAPPEFTWAKTFEKKQNFQALLSKLRKEGFIEKKKKQGITVWGITKQGKDKIRNENEKRDIENTKESPNPIIISYDIPERLRKERQWLRDVLTMLDYQPIHKSVWVGKKQISERLLKELDRREIIDGTQIFEVTRQGTLNKVGKKST